MNVLITGAAGFIGFHLAQRLLIDGIAVYGIDNLNDYYDVNLKQARLAQLQLQPGFTFQLLDVGDRDGMLQLFQTQTFDYVVHLAAQAGVRYSLQTPGLTLTVTSQALLTSSKVVAIQLSSIWSLRLLVPFTGQIQRFPLKLATVLTILYRSMPPAKKQTN